MRKNGSQLLSLGFSSQTRFVIEGLGAGMAPMPFDAPITTRDELIEALRTDGRSMEKSGEGAVMPERANACWRRFAETSRSGTQKTFVLSNADDGLKNFAGAEADFERKFGLDCDAFWALTEALDAFGARNYSVAFLSRSLGEIENTASLQDPRLDHRFVGTLSLRLNLKVAASLFGALAEPSLSMACGAYERSRKLVKAINSDVAIIYDVSADKAQPCGSLTRLNGGFAAFFEGHDQCLTAVSAEHGLYFSNGARWSRDIPDQQQSRHIGPTALGRA